MTRRVTRSMEPSPLYSVEVPKPVEDGIALELPVGGVSFSAGTVLPQSAKVKQIIDVTRSKGDIGRPAEQSERSDGGNPGGSPGAQSNFMTASAPSADVTGE